MYSPRSSSAAPSRMPATNSSSWAMSIKDASSGSLRITSIAISLLLIIESYSNIGLVTIKDGANGVPLFHSRTSFRLLHPAPQGQPLPQNLPVPLLGFGGELVADARQRDFAGGLKKTLPGQKFFGRRCAPRPRHALPIQLAGKRRVWRLAFLHDLSSIPVRHD